MTTRSLAIVTVCGLVAIGMLFGAALWVLAGIAGLLIIGTAT